MKLSKTFLTAIFEEVTTIMYEKIVCELNISKSTVHRVLRLRRTLKFTDNRLKMGFQLIF